MTKFGDPDRLLARAAADVQRDKPWLARKRLRQYLVDQPFDARFAQALGELEASRRDDPAAGRWLWVAGATEPAHVALARSHLDWATSGDQLWRSLPESLRRGIGGREFPQHVLDALRERDIDATQKRANRRRRSRPSRVVGSLLGFAVVSFLVFLLALGALEFVRMVSG